MKNPVETILIVSTDKIKRCVADGRIEEARIINKFTSELLHEFDDSEPVITATQCSVENRFHVGDYITTDLNYKTSIGTAVVNTPEHLDKIMNLYKIVYMDLEYVKLVVIKANPIGHSKNVTFTRPLEAIYKGAKKISVGYPILHDINPKDGDYITTDADYEFPSLDIAAQFSCIKNLYLVTHVEGNLATVEVLKSGDDDGVHTLIVSLSNAKVLPLSGYAKTTVSAIIRHRVSNRYGE